MPSRSCRKSGANLKGVSAHSHPQRAVAQQIAGPRLDPRTFFGHACTGDLDLLEKQPVPGKHDA